MGRPVWKTMTGVTPRTLDVPKWESLPDYARQDLWMVDKNKEENSARIWFNKLAPAYRLTILNLYVKLKGMGFWQFVETLRMGPSTQVGCFEFDATDVHLLRRELTLRWNFRSPQDSLKAWDAMEKRYTAALHFKHFEGWGTRYVHRVQAHIDIAGVWVASENFFWATVGFTGLRHLYYYDSYKDVYAVREALLKQGWDRQVLLGIRKWHCGSRNCPGHSHPDHRCLQGVWFCGRLQPPCPGHGHPEHRCATGRVWTCGSRDCPTHARPEDQCRTGVWFCGRMEPLCPGHRIPDDRCEAGAIKVSSPRVLAFIRTGHGRSS